MIDLDRMEAQLDSALTVRSGRARPSPRRAAVPPRPPTPAPPPRAAAAPTPAPARAPAAEPEPRRRPTRSTGRPSTAPELLELGLVEEADALMTASGHPRDALTWATMRALLDGRRDAARMGVEELRLLAQRTDDAEAWDRFWAQRFWAAVEWGTPEERADVLDHCRQRAYRFDDLPWWGNLTLLLVLMGKQDEAVRAFDEAAELAAVAAKDGRGLDAVTNLIDAAFFLGDAARVAAVARAVRWPDAELLVVGPGVVCKGSVDRYRALAFAATGKPKQAEECFRRAESTHRAIGAGPLLARTLQQASGTVAAA